MQLLSIDFTNLHTILESLYEDMMPLCGDMMAVAKGIAGLGALFYIAVRVWQAMARAEPIDVYPLLRPFAIGICILLFPTLVLGTLNNTLGLIVEGTHSMLETQTMDMEQYREQILQNHMNYNVIYPLMEAEGMYEHMLECLKREGFVLNLDRYEKVLKERFPEQVRDLYISYLHREAETARNRNRYRELMKYLKKISGYPGGKEKAAGIAEDWRAKYYRRRAMMDEIEKAGF